MAESHVFSLVGAFLAPGTCRCFWMLQRPGRLSCRMCPWNPQGSRALNYRLQQLHTADLQLAAICCRTNVAGERARLVLRWWRWDRIIRRQTRRRTRRDLLLLCVSLSSRRALLQGVDVRRKPGDSPLQPRGSRVQETAPVRLPRRQRSHLHQVSGLKKKRKKLTSCLLHRVITPAKKKNNLPTARKVNLLVRFENLQRHMIQRRRSVWS